MADDVPFRQESRQIRAEGRKAQVGRFQKQAAQARMKRQARHGPAGRCNRTFCIQRAQSFEQLPRCTPGSGRRRIEPGKRGRVPDAPGGQIQNQRR